MPSFAKSYDNANFCDCCTLFDGDVKVFNNCVYVAWIKRKTSQDVRPHVVLRLRKRKQKSKIKHLKLPIKF